MKMKKIEKFILPEHKNNYQMGASTTLALIKEVVSKMNELVDLYNDQYSFNLKTHQKQDGEIRESVRFMKDNLINSLDSLMKDLNNSGFIDSRIQANVKAFTDEAKMLSARLDNLLGRVTVGSTTMDAEIIDARTNHAGFTFPTIGTTIRTTFAEALKSSNLNVSANSYQNITTDVNNLNPNNTYFFNLNVTEDMVKNLPEYNTYMVISTFNFSREIDHGKYQLAFTYSGNMYYRMEQGNNDIYFWTNWTKINDVNTIDNFHSFEIFDKVVCLGDSFTSGHIQIAQGMTLKNERFSWVKYLAKISGNNYINCGVSGANTKTILSASEGMVKLKSSGKANAYLVALGLNDTATGTDRAIPLGTQNDVTTKADTYYGNYAKIIEEIKLVSPSAHIFLMTIPNPNELQASYNEAVKFIANHFNVHLLDLDNYKTLFNDEVLIKDKINGHYSAIGYNKIAHNLKYVWSDYINKNQHLFQNVHLIEIE